MNRCGMIALTTIALASPALAASGDASSGLVRHVIRSNATAI